MFPPTPRSQDCEQGQAPGAGSLQRAINPLLVLIADTITEVST